MEREDGKEGSQVWAQLGVHLGTPFVDPAYPNVRFSVVRGPSRPMLAHSKHKGTLSGCRWMSRELGTREQAPCMSH